MILSFAPFRISLGACDNPYFVEKHGGFCLGFTISLGVLLGIRYTPDILDYNYSIHYSRSELVNTYEEIAHNGARGCLQFLNERKGITINCDTDLPAKSGVGSSSAFIVAALNGLYRLRGVKILKRELAELSIYVERKLLLEEGGIHDEIQSAYGGFNSVDIDKSGSFKVRPLPITEEFKQEFLEHSLLLFLGESRDSFEIAKSYNSTESDRHKLDIKLSLFRMYNGFVAEDIFEIAESMNQAWESKRKISDKISNEKVNSIIGRLREAGAYSCRLMGNGGSGFVFCLVPPNKRENVLEVGLQKVDFKYDNDGAKIIYG